jgi:hypothetical protein
VSEHFFAFEKGTKKEGAQVCFGVDERKTMNYFREAHCEGEKDEGIMITFQKEPEPTG